MHDGLRQIDVTRFLSHRAVCWMFRTSGV